MSMISNLYELNILTMTLCPSGLRLKILFLCKLYPGITPKELMSKLSLTKGNLANQCKELVFNSFLEQKHGKEDKRSICYFLTEKGSNFLEKELDKSGLVFSNNTNSQSLQNAIETILSFLNKKI